MKSATYVFATLHGCIRLTGSSATSEFRFSLNLIHHEYILHLLAADRNKPTLTITQSDVAGRFRLHGGRKPLPGVVAPGTARVQFQVRLPVLPRFGKCAQFFADVGKIVLCVW